MVLDVEINDSSQASARYIANAPSPCRIRLSAPAAAPVHVTLSSRQAQASGGQAVLYASAGHASQETLDLVLPADASWISFGLGGKFGMPSTEDGDCLLAINGAGAEITVPLMVRIRKNANTLTAGERSRFLEALAKLNAHGAGLYQQFRDTHVAAADDEEHGGSQFLPWHRTFLLDLERELQLIDPSVALPYWRFDEPAPNVFRSNFMGATRQVPDNAPATQVVFDQGHPLAGWVTDNQPGILRSSNFNTQTSPAPGLAALGFPLLNQAATLGLGDVYETFADMESSPHGAAHVSFHGPISSVPTAVKDPLFFLLHANVDRLWALWQWLNRRTNPTDPKVYQEQQRDGRRLNDSSWPWNGVTTPPRPDFAPGGPLPNSPVTAAPGATPTVRSVIDFEGHMLPSARIGYGYDDVPFEFS